eukprot:bmy_20869T0
MKLGESRNCEEVEARTQRKAFQEKIKSPVSTKLGCLVKKLKKTLQYQPGDLPGSQQQTSPQNSGMTLEHKIPDDRHMPCYNNQVLLNEFLGSRMVKQTEGESMYVYEHWNIREGCGLRVPGAGSNREEPSVMSSLLDRFLEQEGK